MRKQTTIILLACITALVISACSDNEQVSGPIPEITWKMTAARFTVYQREVLSIVPDVLYTDETTTWSWQMNGEVISQEDHCTFQSEEKGEYYIQLRVTNRYGEANDEVKVTVLEKAEEYVDPLPQNDSLFIWRWPYSEINIPYGRSIQLRPYMLENAEGVSFRWYVNGLATEETAMTFVFQGIEQGETLISLRAEKDTMQREQTIRVNVCPPSGTYRRQGNGSKKATLNKVFEYQPAPSHQVNGYIIINKDRLNFPNGCTHEQACDTVLSHFSKGHMISLGACGGYVTVGFDQSIPSRADGYDLYIKGNPFSYQSEPGIIWVSQDVNGDGLPNDLWYELAGSEYGSERHQKDYAITYYRPSRPHSAIRWRDSDGMDDIIPYMSYWNPQPYYWQDWQEGNELTFFGSRLASNYTYDGGISDIIPYPWGYADNEGSDFIEGTDGKMGYYHISNARTWDGDEANLEYIDFVRIQTAETGWTPNLGDISTEIYLIGEPSDP